MTLSSFLSAEGDARLYKNLDQATLRLIKRVFSKEFHGKLNEVLLIPAPEDIKPQRILLVGLGKESRYLGREDAAGWREGSCLSARFGDKKNRTFNRCILVLRYFTGGFSRRLFARSLHLQKIYRRKE